MKKLFFYICITIALGFHYIADLLEDAFSWWTEETEISKRIKNDKDKW